MKYHSYYAISQGMSFNIQEAYARLIKSLEENNKLASASIAKLEGYWCRDKKPYYRVSPDVIPLLLKYDISGLHCFRVAFHKEAITFNFPVGHELHGCTSILAGKDFIKGKSVLTFVAQGDWQMGRLCCLPFEADMTITDVFERVTDEAAKRAGFDNRTQVCDIVQVLCATSQFKCKPEVLASDAGKPYTDELWGKAMKRGKVGWLITNV